MILPRPLIGLSELCILDKNSEEVHNLQSHDGLLDENAEENRHHNLQSPNGLRDKNAEEAHNLQSSDGLLDENSEEVHNLQSPDEKNVFLTAFRTLSP